MRKNSNNYQFTGDFMYSKITNAANNAWQELYAEKTMDQAGYVYIYTATESNTNVDIYFDDFDIQVEQTHIVAGNDYYPFGLPMVERSYEKQDYRYDYQGAYSEKDDETGYNAFQLRMYDARIGRWISPDPYGQFASAYVGMGNNPVSGVDPDGGWLMPLSWQGAIIGTAVGAGIGLAFDKENWGYYAAGMGLAGSFLMSDWSKVNIWKTHDYGGLAPVKSGLFRGRHKIRYIKEKSIKYIRPKSHGYKKIDTPSISFDLEVPSERKDLEDVPPRRQIPPPVAVTRPIFNSNSSSLRNDEYTSSFINQITDNLENDPCLRVTIFTDTNLAQRPAAPISTNIGNFPAGADITSFSTARARAIAQSVLDRGLSINGRRVLFSPGNFNSSNQVRVIYSRIPNCR